MNHTAIPSRASLQDLGDVEIEAIVEFGRTSMSLRQARKLSVGDAITLDKLGGESMEVRLNGLLFAEGETVCVADRLCCRLTRLQDPVEARRSAAEGVNS